MHVARYGQNWGKLHLFYPTHQVCQTPSELWYEGVLPSFWLHNALKFTEYFLKEFQIYLWKHEELRRFFGAVAAAVIAKIMLESAPVSIATSNMTRSYNKLCVFPASNLVRVTINSEHDLTLDCGSFDVYLVGRLTPWPRGQLGWWGRTRLLCQGWYI